MADVGTDVTATIDVPGAGTFHYRVRAHSASGDSAWNAWAQIKN